MDSVLRDMVGGLMRWAIDCSFGSDKVYLCCWVM